METEFIEFLTERGMENPADLFGFIEKYLDNPGIFFELGQDERQKIEKRFDDAIAVIASVG